MGRASKDKRDIYYRKAKEEGYRARSAYKLLQIQETCSILDNITNGVVDLCAAPGSWSQVLSRLLRSQTPDGRTPPPIIAVDLQEMAPIDGVTIIQGDITSEKTAREIIDLLTKAGLRRRQEEEEEAEEGTTRKRSRSPDAEEKGGQSSSAPAVQADLVICDGAPDVTGLHELDEYLQHHLLAAALHITTHILRPGGRFVTKVFRGPNTSFLIAKYEVFFSSVFILKPTSSRNASMECFMVCEGFHLPEGFHPSFERTASGGAAVGVGGQQPPPPPQDWVSQQYLQSFLACGDLSGYDADMSYER